MLEVASISMFFGKDNNVCWQITLSRQRIAEAYDVALIRGALRWSFSIHPYPVLLSSLSLPPSAHLLVLASHPQHFCEIAPQAVSALGQ